MDDFVVADDSDEEVKPSKKRKRPTNRQAPKSSPPPLPSTADDEIDLDIPEAPSGTTLKWTYDPENLEPRQPRAAPTSSNTPSSAVKQKAHLKEPEERYPWLANIRDADSHPIGHPEYDPRTLYIPPLAWSRFSPFEKQYWEI